MAFNAPRVGIKVDMYWKWNWMQLRCYWIAYIYRFQYMMLNASRSSWEIRIEKNYPYRCKAESELGLCA